MNENKREANDGIRKVCGCARRRWAKCQHPWHFNFKWRDTHYRFSLDRQLGRHVDRKSEARAEADKLRALIRAGEFGTGTKPQVTSVMIRGLFEIFHREYLQTARPATLSNLASQARVIMRTIVPRPSGGPLPLGDWPVVDVTTSAMTRFGDVRRQAGVAAANRDLSLLRSMFNWAIRMELIDRTPFKRGTEPVVKLRPEPPRARRLDADEGERLLSACGSALRPLVEAALETGCRRGELLSLQWHQVRWTPRAEIVLPAAKTKTRRDRRIPMSSRLRSILAMRSHAPDGKPHPADAYVFGNEIGERVHTFKRAWQAAVLRAHNVKPEYVKHVAVDDRTGDKKTVRTGMLTSECRAKLRRINLHFHDLRREAGSRWLEGGVPLHTVRDWLGHANISQTSTYLEGTIQGQHDAMRLFDERRTALQPSATDIGKGVNQRPQDATVTDSEPSASAQITH
jgi:integrase